MGLPKVKRDKFSVFNFLTVTESREAPGGSSSLQGAPWVSSHLLSVPDGVKKSRWDVSEQQKKEETLNQLISAARQQSSAHTPPTSTSRAEVQLQHRPPLESSFSPSPLLTQAKNSDEEEEQEESRPPMDLFKAIFSDSSEEKSSSSSSSEAESNDEDQATNKEPADLFLITSSSTTTTSTTTSSSSQQTGEEILFIRAFPRRFSSFICSSLLEHTPAPPEAVLPSRSSALAQDEEVFGPRLPPPPTQTGQLQSPARLLTRDWR